MNEEVKNENVQQQMQTEPDKQPAPVSPNKKGSKLPIIIAITAVLLIAIIVVVVLIVKDSEPKEKVYLTENEAPLIYSQPDNYKNKYIKTSAQVMYVKQDKKGQIITAVTDIEKYTNDIIIYLEDKTVAIKDQDYISVDGYIKGADKDTSKPYIIGKEIKVISYLEAVAPTTKEVNLDKTVSQNDVSVTIKKVEFSDVETRVYVKATNNSNYEFSLYSYSSFLTQAGKQYETTYSKNSVDMSSTILAGGSTEGVIVFPKVEQSNFTITMKGYSSNYQLDFENFSFEVQVN